MWKLALVNPRPLFQSNTGNTQSNKVNIEELLKLMTIQHLPTYGEMIYYITKYHIKYPLNIHNREESTSKKGQTEVA